MQPHRRRLTPSTLFVLVVTIVPGLFFGHLAWRTCGRYGERCAEANRFYPVYDAQTGRIAVIIHDLSGNGVVDTWVRRSSAGVERIEIDLNEDGVMDRRLFLGPDGRSWRVEAVAANDAPVHP